MLLKRAERKELEFLGDKIMEDQQHYPWVSFPDLAERKCVPISII